MSARTTAFRGNGDTRVVPLNGGGSVLAPNMLRLRTLAVKAGTNPTTVGLTVDGVSVLAQSENRTVGGGALSAVASAENPVVAAGTVSVYEFGGDVVVNQGSVIAATSTDGAALISLGFMAA